jgi:hypothetical protein
MNMLEIIIYNKTYFINVHIMVCYVSTVKQEALMKLDTGEFYKKLLRHSYFVSQWCHSVTLIIDKML